MSWFPVDDGAHSHPKMRRAGLEAVGLWTVSGSFCMAYLTDGFVPEWFVKEKPRGAALAKRLVEAGLWTAGTNGEEKGWWFHDWKPECTKARIQEARESARIRKQKSRDQNRDKQRQSRVTEPVTDEGRHAGVLGYPAQPSPAQPNKRSLVTSGGGVASVDAHDPRPQCPKHPDGNPNDENCRGCKRIREWDEQHTADAEADDLARQRATRALAAQALTACGLCDDAGWLLDHDGLPHEPAIRCQHQETAAHA